MTKRKIDILLESYGESHQNPTNKLIHWICVPVIMFTLMGLLYLIPLPFAFLPDSCQNFAFIAVLFTLIYYGTLSFSLFLGFLGIGLGLVLGNHYLYNLIVHQYNLSYLLFCILVFVLAWIGQFIGHHIEGKKPSFLKDLQFLLVGPAWLLHFIFKKIGIPY